MYKSSARISLHLLPGFEFLKIKSVLYDTDNTPKNVTVWFESIRVQYLDGSEPMRVLHSGRGQNPTQYYQSGFGHF